MKYIGREEIITDTKDWTVPKARDQKFQVALYGAGGSGSINGNYFQNVGGAGGGSGDYAFKELELKEGDRIHIEIGKGGEGMTGSDKVADYIGHIVGKTGGTTSFGEYLFAVGGLGGNIDQGGDGANDGGATGETAEGHYFGNGSSGTVDGLNYTSGGGGAAVNARGVGGSAEFNQGNGGTSAGGAGCFVEKVDGKVSRRIGAGGNGVCIITYYAPISG